MEDSMDDIVQIVVTKTKLCEDGYPVYKVVAMTATKTLGAGYHVLPERALKDIASLMETLVIP
jgi:hypothetical protein